MKLTVRLWLQTVCIIITVMLLVWIFLILLLPMVYARSAEKNLRDTLNSCVNYIFDEFPDDLGENARNSLDILASETGARIELINSGGGTILISGWGEGWQPLYYDELDAVWTDGELLKTAYRPGFGDILVMADYLVTQSGAPVIISVSMPIAPINDSMSVLSRQLILVIAASLVISVPAAYYFSHSFLRPIRHIQALAGDISRGEYGKQINVKDSSEIGELADMINIMSKKLNEVEAMQRNYISTVSHQYKTPLAVIQGHLELITDTLPEEYAEKYRPHTDRVLAEIQKLDGMARGMLRLRQVQDSSFKKEPIAIRELCSEILEKLKMLDRDGKIKSDIADVTVKADAEGMSHVFENLLKNALKHANASEIRLTVNALEDGKIRVSVSDDGIGLSKEESSRVWDKFYKKDRNNTDNTGLGLAIVKEVLEAHGAEYGLVSSPGEGSDFWFIM